MIRRVENKSSAGLNSLARFENGIYSCHLLISKIIFMTTIWSLNLSISQQHPTVIETPRSFKTIGITPAGNISSYKDEMFPYKEFQKSHHWNFSFPLESFGTKDIKPKQPLNFHIRNLSSTCGICNQNYDNQIQKFLQTPKSRKKFQERRKYHRSFVIHKDKCRHLFITQKINKILGQTLFERKGNEEFPEDHKSFCHRMIYYLRMINHLEPIPDYCLTPSGLLKRPAADWRCILNPKSSQSQRSHRKQVSYHYHVKSVKLLSNKTTIENDLRLEKEKVLKGPNGIVSLLTSANYDKLIAVPQNNGRPSKPHSFVIQHSIRKRETPPMRRREMRSTDRQSIIHYSLKNVSSASRQRSKVETVNVEAIAGSTAKLPCKLKTIDSKDSVQLVLWIKEGMHTPLYSYDHREQEGSSPKESKPNVNSTLSRRTFFRTDIDPASLVIEQLAGADTGIYRCRVDFLLSPTRNTKVKLTVIVPPSRAKVTWSDRMTGVSMSETSLPSDTGEVGPFRENALAMLICSNDDGIPLPRVIWYELDKAIDDTYEIDEMSGVVSNTLRLGPLRRNDIGRRLTCHASNTNKTQPATATVTIGMILKILGVEIHVPNEIQADLTTDIQCQVKGSRPVPVINWWLGSRKLKALKAPQVLEGANLTVSVMQFIPDSADDGSMLICQAVNPEIPEEVIQDSKLISVTYMPHVQVNLGRSLDPNKIKEGDDVYFECSVQAKPPAFKIEWKHNGVSLEGSSSIFVSNMSLVVQGVQRKNGGKYTCHATNAKGTGASDPLDLDVKYAPVCASKQRTQHSAAKEENAEISCLVHANPPTVTFRWTFNNTAEAIDVPDGRFVVSGTESRVNYTPMNELDYGTLLCWANNSIGIQENPCVFHIVAAGKPDPPHNCKVFEVTISSLQVACLAGDDGGLEQQFLLQVFKLGSTSPITEIKKTTPSFSVANLRPATAYKILVVSLNEKGASRATELKAYTVRVPASQEETSAEPARDRDRDKSNIPLAVIVGSSLAAVPVIMVVVFVVWLKVCRRNRSNRKTNGHQIGTNRNCTRRRNGVPLADSMQSVSCKDASIARSSLDLPLSTDSSNADECNPDLISHTPDPTDCSVNFTGEISTISTSGSGYYLGNGGTSYVVGSPVGSHPSEMIQLVSGDQQNRSSGVRNILSPLQSSSRHSGNHNQVPYTSRDAKQAPQHFINVTLPPPENYKQGYPEVSKSCTDPNKTRKYGENVRDTTFSSPFPHVYQSLGRSQNTPSFQDGICYPDSKESYNTASICHTYDGHSCSRQVNCSREYPCSRVSSGIDFCKEKGQGKHRSTQFLDICHSNCTQHYPVTSDTAHHMGTLRRGNGSKDCSSGQLRRDNKGGSKGSLPDVRGSSSSNKDSPGKSKRESAV